MANLLDIFIRTQSDTGGAQTAEKALQNVTSSGQNAGKPVDDLAAKLRELGPAGREAGSFLSRAIAALATPLGAAVAGFGGLVLAIKEAASALKAFSQQELSETDLAASLKAMGQYTDDYNAKLGALSSQLQETTGIGDEAWLNSMATLTRFGMHAGNVDKVTGALKNLAGLVHGDMGSATMLLQRAMEGQFTMFSRYGIVLERTGDKTKDLDNLFRLLAQKGAGVLEARVETLTGQHNLMTDSINDAKQAIGRWVAGLGIAQARMSEITDTARALDKVFTGTGESTQFLEEELGAITSEPLKKVAETAEEAAKRLEQSANQAKSLRAAIDELSDAEDDLASAQIKKQVAEGKITKEEGARRCGRDRPLHASPSASRARRC